MEAFSLYVPNMVAAAFAALALALLGAQLAARGESLQALVASQSASLGTTLGLCVLVLMGVLRGDELHWLPWLLSLVVAMGAYGVGQKLCARHPVKSSLILVTIFLASLATTYLLTSLMPSLESHFASGFLGDLATASAGSAWYLTTLSFAVAVVLFANWRLLSLQSFWLASAGVLMRRPLARMFYLVAAIVVVESTRIFGFLFTASSLIVVPLMATWRLRDLRSYTQRLVLAAVLPTVSGFALSLWHEQMSTSATVVFAQLAVGLLLVALPAPVVVEEPTCDCC